MFVLLFAFVFGGAITVPGGRLHAYLMPGIFAQTIVFAAGTTAIGMTDDIAKGIIDRFRSLPMARSAVLTGRTFSDVIYNAGILVVLMLTGLAVGWRSTHPGVPGGLRLLLLFAFAMSWLGVSLGLNGAVGGGRPAGHLHGALPDHVRLQRLRAARDPAGVAPADRRVEPDEHADRRPARAVGQQAPTRSHGQLRLAEPVLVTLVWVVSSSSSGRSASAATADEPLTLMAAPPWLLALGLVLGLLVLLPARRLQLAGLAPPLDRLVRSHPVGAAMLVAMSPGGARVLIPILLVAYLAPFVAAPDRVGRPAAGGGSGGRGRTGRPSRTSRRPTRQRPDGSVTVEPRA